MQLEFSRFLGQYSDRPYTKENVISVSSRFRSKISTVARGIPPQPPLYKPLCKREEEDSWLTLRKGGGDQVNWQGVSR